MSGITFEALLEAARLQENGVDPGRLEEARRKVEKLREKFELVRGQLDQARKELVELEKASQTYIKRAIDAAKALGLEIPQEYRQEYRKVRAGNGNGNRSNGKYYWEPYGQKPFRAEISRAMWRLSQGCGGSAGKNGEGVLSVEEFWQLVESQTGKSQLALGEKIRIELPSGKVVEVQKVEE